MLTPEGLKQVVYTGTSISCAALFYGMPLAGDEMPERAHAYQTPLNLMIWNEIL
jgi:hypothetical protein